MAGCDARSGDGMKTYGAVMVLGFEISALLAITLSLFTGCALPMPECTGSGTCGNGQMCLQSECVTQCTVDEDCLEGETCTITTVTDALLSAGWHGSICEDDAPGLE